LLASLVVTNLGSRRMIFASGRATRWIARHIASLWTLCIGSLRRVASWPPPFLLRPRLLALPLNEHLSPPRFAFQPPCALTHGICGAIAFFLRRCCIHTAKPEPAPFVDAQGENQ